MRRAAKVDDNQQDIVDGLREIGASVFITSGVGDGFPDLTCGFNGVNWLFEVKNPEQPPSKRRLTDDEQAFMLAWRGQYAVVETAEQAIALVTA